MPLSEHEERILAEIERRLQDDDPRFVARARRAAHGGNPGRRRWLALGLFLLGLVVAAGLAISIVFGLVGFALMFAGLVVGATTLRLPDDAQRARQDADHDG